MSVTIYHNPRCAKSRETLKLIEARGLRPNVVEYLKTPPTANELKHILKMLKLPARQLLRQKEEEYKKARLDKTTLSKDDLVQAMVKYPKLIERPIVVHANRAAIGRPPENVLEILK